MLVSNHPFHHASAEALTRRLPDRWTATLGPSEIKLVDLTSTQPSTTDSAPYLAALVASSCKIIAIV